MFGQRRVKKEVYSRNFLKKQKKSPFSLAAERKRTLIKDYDIEYYMIATRNYPLCCKMLFLGSVLQKCCKNGFPKIPNRGNP